MIKMIIVDDSQIELNGLRELIDWNSMGIEIIGVASNGKKALELIETQTPDILLTDIKMPVMNGIELAARLRELNSSIKIIFLSAYEDFNYAKKGIELNVHSYVTKPIRINDLIDVIQKVVKIHQQEDNYLYNQEKLQKQLEESLPLLKEKFINGLINGQYVDSDSIKRKLEYLGIPLKADMRYTVFLVVNEDTQQTNDEKMRNLLSLCILNELKEVNYEDFYSVAYQVQENHYAVIMQYSELENSDSFQRLEESIDKIKNRIYEHTGMNFTFFIGREVIELKDIAKSYKDTQTLLSCHFSFGEKDVIFYYEMDSAENNESDEMNFDYIKDMDEKFTNYIISGNNEEISSLINNMFDYVSERKNIDNSYIQNLCIYIISLGMKVLYERNIDPNEIFDGQTIMRKLLKFNTIVNVRQWMINILTTFANRVSENKLSKNQVVVNQALSYVEGHYRNNITLADVSKEIYLSPNYIGAIFKSVTGESFNDYLTKFRMEMAKKLLTDMNKKIYEASYEVGYTNISYFCTKFKNHFGISPTEYREHLGFNQVESRKGR